MNEAKIMIVVPHLDAKVDTVTNFLNSSGIDWKFLLPPHAMNSGTVMAILVRSRDAATMHSLLMNRKVEGFIYHGQITESAILEHVSSIRDWLLSDGTSPGTPQ